MHSPDSHAASTPRPAPPRSVLHFSPAGLTNALARCHMHMVCRAPGSQELLEERSKNRMAQSRLSEVKDKYESRCEGYEAELQQLATQHQRELDRQRTTTLTSFGTISISRAFLSPPPPPPPPPL